MEETDNGITPTLLLDEADAMFKGKKELDDDLRGLINAGHRKGGKITRSVFQGGRWVPQKLSVFAPKAIAGIGKLPDTVTDRSIPIELKRRRSSEPVARFYFREVKEEVEPIVNGLVSWAGENLHRLEDARPDISFITSDRSADGWEPLLAIAELTGSEWSERAKRASMMLSNNEDVDDTITIKLLDDIASVFQKVGADRISSADLIQRLSDMEESPWSDYFGKPITNRHLAKWLKEYGISSHSVRIDDKTPKGFMREDFADAWSRYTPHVSATAQHPESELEPTTEDMFGSADVADGNTPEMQEFELEVADVAVKREVKTEAVEDVVEI
jgi:hypothetical protein